MHASTILGLAAAAIGLAGCGGTEGDDRLSRSALTREVNAACRELERVTRATPPSGRDDIAAYFERSLPPRRALLDGLPAADRAPEQIEQDYARFVQARRDELDALADVGRTVGDLVASNTAAQEVEQARRTAAQLGATLRFEDCDGTASR